MTSRIDAINITCRDHEALGAFWQLRDADGYEVCVQRSREEIAAASGPAEV